MFVWAIAILCPPTGASAGPITVRYTEGTVHGFLVLKSADGKALADGDLVQVVHGERVVSHLVFHFKDGSLDDDTAVFSQRESFRLISEHHIQRGPVFVSPVDLSIDVPTGTVTVRYQEKGTQKVATQHLELPPDLANGIIIYDLKDIAPGTPETKLSWLATTPKPRLVKLAITPEGDATFSIAGAHRKAYRLNVKVELGGLAGVIAPLIGKQPADIQVWILGGDAPAFLRMVGPLFLNGPIWTMEMTNPVLISGR